MAFIHSFAARHPSGLMGVQADQRDWSPFVVHFTRWGAMSEVRKVYKNNESHNTTSEVHSKLAAADAASFETFKKIVEQKTIAINQLTNAERNPLPISPCVCLSECAFPGLLGHAERYGRFGFAFEKKDIWQHGGRPCVYVDDAHYQSVSTSFRDSQPQLFSLYNKFVPVHAAAGSERQDYAHEREWRAFDPIRLNEIPIAAVFVPDQSYIERAETAFRSACLSPGFILPMSTMFSWGV